MAIELAAEPRSELGKEKCKKLRAAGRLPGNIYGGAFGDPRAISMDLHETEKTIRKHGKSADYSLSLEGNSYPVKIQEVRTEPIYKRFLHVDLLVQADG
ncbi:hypothetical protein IIA79_05465 [bacterium]|nr:hypothetical protein [bacterium]